MSTPSRRMRLVCPQCAAAATCGLREMLLRLRTLGMLRREKEPEWDLVVELFRSAAARLPCDQCGQVGLRVSPAEDDFDDETWGGSRRCESCGQPIPEERVRMLPNVALCVVCQQARESGTAAQAVDYCPQCGAVRHLRLRTGDALARYQPYCPECRR